MITMEKPALNEDLLIHYGIPGMKWGRRKARDDSGGGRRSSSGKPSSSSGGPQRQGLSRGTKIAIGVAGLAAAGYFLSKTGTAPSARAMTGASNRAGRRAVAGVLKSYGKVGVRSLKAAPKVLGGASKATYRTTKFVGTKVTRGTIQVSKTTGRNIATKISEIRNAPVRSAPSIRGKRFGNMLMGRYGQQPVSVLGNFRQVMSDRALQRTYGSS